MALLKRLAIAFVLLPGITPAVAGDRRITRRMAAGAKVGREPWHTCRLPIACASYTGDHGWHTECPASKVHPHDAHGGWYELPVTFDVERPTGIRPLCSHLKITSDVTAVFRSGTRDGPWHETAVEAGKPSDPYLMAGYDRKRIEVSQDAALPVTVTIEIDPAGDGTWFASTKREVPPGETVRHEFPAGVSAHWVRLVADRKCVGTATFTYE